MQPVGVYVLSKVNDQLVTHLREASSVFDGSKISDLLDLKQRLEAVLQNEKEAEDRCFEQAEVYASEYNYEYSDRHDTLLLPGKQYFLGPRLKGDNAQFVGADSVEQGLRNWEDVGSLSAGEEAEAQRLTNGPIQQLSQFVQDLESFTVALALAPVPPGPWNEGVRAIFEQKTAYRFEGAQRKDLTVWASELKSRLSAVHSAPVECRVVGKGKIQEFEIVQIGTWKMFGIWKMPITELRPLYQEVPGQTTPQQEVWVSRPLETVQAVDHWLVFS